MMIAYAPAGKASSARRAVSGRGVKYIAFSTRT